MLTLLAINQTACTHSYGLVVFAYSDMWSGMVVWLDTQKFLPYETAIETTAEKKI